MPPWEAKEISDFERQIFQSTALHLAEWTLCSEESDSILIEAPPEQSLPRGTALLGDEALIRFFAEIKENSLQEADNLAFSHSFSILKTLIIH